MRPFPLQAGALTYTSPDNGPLYNQGNDQIVNTTVTMSINVKSPALGSPGMGVDKASELTIDPRHVWVGPRGFPAGRRPSGRRPAWPRVPRPPHGGRSRFVSPRVPGSGAFRSYSGREIDPEKRGGPG